MSDNSAASNLPAFTPLTLTLIPEPESLIATATSVIESTEGALKLGLNGTAGVFGDPVKGLDIGYGCQLNATNMPYIVAAMLGVPVSDDDVSFLTLELDSAMSGLTTVAGVQAALNSVMNDYSPGMTFTLTPAAAQTALTSILTNVTIPALDTVLESDGAFSLTYSVGGGSQEYVALLDLYYAGQGNLIGSHSQLLAALGQGNRAQAWFEIRYGSNGNALPGIAKRRYYDSQLFGLFSNPSNPPSLGEVVQAYQMLTTNRSAIIQYEALYGVDPDGGGQHVSNDAIDSANSDYQLSGTAQVQTLQQAFANAAPVLLGMIADDSPLLANIASSPFGAGLTDTNIFVASASSATVDASPGDPAVNISGQSALSAELTSADALEADANHLLIGTGNDETLIGGLGEDLLIAGGGSETLRAGDGSDTIVAGSGNDLVVIGGVSDVVDFEFGTGTGLTETVELNSPGDVDTLDIGGSSIGTGLTFAGQNTSGEDTWTGGGNTYTFNPNPSNPPPGYTATQNGDDIGLLSIQTASGNTINVWGFDLTMANSVAGYFGIYTPGSVSILFGSVAGGNPPDPAFTAGTTQSYTVSVDASSDAPQAVTMTLSGAPASDFGLISGATIVPLNSDGTFTVTIPAGDTSVAFSLANTGDVGSSATLQLTASLADPNAQNGTISSAPLTQSYVEPASDPFATPVAPQLYYYGSESINGESVGTYSDVSNNSPTAVGSIADGNEFINLDGPGGESINGGTGSDTITGAFIQPANVNGGVGAVDVISANGGQDIINIGGDYAYPSQMPPVQIYGNSAEDLAQAISDAEDGTPTHEQGDLISTSIDDSTIVGGDGNDLIMSSSNGVIVAGPGDDTIVGGGNLSYTGLPPALAGATWSAELSGNQLNLSGSDSIALATSATSYSYPGYEGSFDSFGYALGTSNQTIFGGAGDDAILLSNGNNAVNLGNGDSTVYGGMGSNTITGGSGSDSIVGGGGGDYIVAGAGNDFIAGYGGNNTIFGGTGTDTIFAGAGDSQWANAETGNNYVEAGSGNTLIYGSGGADTLIGGAGSDTIDAGDGNESIVAGSGDTSITGGNGADTIVAGSGSDTILGSTGSTTIYGGTGVDQISGEGGTDVIYAGDGGTSEAATSVAAGSGDTTIYGGQGVDQISGGDGNDVIYAGDGGTAEEATQVVAGSGDTTIYGGDGIDHIFGGSGTDVLYAGDGGEEGNLTYVTAGTGVATLYGGAGASVLRDDQNGNDVLEGGSGNTALYGVGQDTLIAGNGSDYLVGGSNSTDVFGSDSGIDEVVDGGTETLEFTPAVDSSDLSLSAALDSAGAGSLTINEGDSSITVDGGLSGANVASVDFEGSQPMSLTQLIQQANSAGSVSATTLAGNDGNFIFDVANGDAVSGGSGEDTISAWGNDDTLTSGSGGGEILAEGTDDLVTGGTGNDTLDAVAAGTTLVGGTGNEVFEVNDATDVVEAQADASSNQIESSVSYTLPTNVDVLTLTGTGDLSGTGNSDAGNLITGNSGNDTLIAGSGSDTLVSGSEADTLIGGSGPDTFVVNNSADLVEPLSYEGWQDTIQSSVSYVLTAPVSTLQLTGSGDLSATDDYGYASITGNAGEDTLTGGSGNDTLIAGTGVDTLIAGSGNTLFVVDNAADAVQVTGQAGSDTVESSVSYTLGQGVDILELTGSSDLQGQGNADAANLIEANSGDDTLVAGSGSDTLVAGSASDTLVAGSGTDVLEGGTGSTTYAFDSGFGQAEIKPGSGNGTIAFGAGITASDLTVGLTTDSSGNPALLIQDGSSTVTVDGGLGGSIGGFDFADGTQLTLGGLLTAATATPGSLAGANGNAILNTTADASLSGGYGNDSILGTGASDTLTAGSGSQYLLGAGDDDSITGAFGNDTLVGDGASDTLVAGNGSQELYGIGTGDVLIGGMGDDTLYGGVGNDTFVSGTGGTVIYGGNTGDSLVLTEGADVTFYPSSTNGVELIQLPNQMTLADFTSYEGAGGDLILQSLSGDTTAVIEGFYSGTNQKTWLITDSSGTTQSLSTWVSSNQQPPSNYQAQIAGLEQAYAANLPAILNQVGQQGGSISDPGYVFTQTPQSQYQFDGVTTEDVAVQGGVLNLGSSADVQSSYTVLQTGSTTYTETIPQYSEVTIPGSTSFIPDSSLDSLDQSNIQNEVGGNGGFSVEEGTDANGDPGYQVTMLPYTEEEQTGTQTIVETVPTYTAYSQTTEAFVDYNVTGDGGNDVIDATGPFVGTVVTGNGNVSLDLGMQNGGQYSYDYPNEPALGAFIDAGNGNDSIIGSGGSDTIAAGTGYDYIEAAIGSTVYVPLQGTSTEEIDIELPDYGRGPLPPSTLVLPMG